MPKLVGTSTVVVDHEGICIEELAGNVASKEDTLSVARVTISTPCAEPWLTLDYDEWICCLKGKIQLHYNDGGTDKVLHVSAGQTCFIAKGERFQPVFPEAGTEYIPVCFPAFTPERCHREEQPNSTVSLRLNELHSSKNSKTTRSNNTTNSTNNKLYHMCQSSLWNAALESKKAYYPPTFVKDGNFTHATAVPQRLLETANHFYTSITGDWICVELDQQALENVGIVTVFEDPKPVGDAPVGSTWNEWRCPHIFGGIPAFLPGIVQRIYRMNRGADGSFLSIEGLTN
jgi:uncharacterized protein (DUF952 family)